MTSPLAETEQTERAVDYHTPYWTDLPKGAIDYEGCLAKLREGWVLCISTSPLGIAYNLTQPRSVVAKLPVEQRLNYSLDVKLGQRLHKVALRLVDENVWRGRDFWVDANYYAYGQPSAEEARNELFNIMRRIAWRH